MTSGGIGGFGFRTHHSTRLACAVGPHRLVSTSVRGGGSYPLYWVDMVQKVADADRALLVTQWVSATSVLPPTKARFIAEKSFVQDTYVT